MSTTPAKSVLIAIDAVDLSVIILRLRLLSRIDVWIPLILQKDFFEENDTLPSLHSLLSVPLERLGNLLPRGGLWPSRGGTTFKTIFDKLGLPHHIAKHGDWYFESGAKKVLQWVNFSEKCTGLPQELWSGQRHYRQIQNSRLLRGTGVLSVEKDRDQSEKRSGCLLLLAQCEQEQLLSLLRDDLQFDSPDFLSLRRRKKCFFDGEERGPYRAAAVNGLRVLTPGCVRAALSTGGFNSVVFEALQGDDDTSSGSDYEDDFDSEDEDDEEFEEEEELFLELQTKGAEEGRRRTIGDDSSTGSSSSSSSRSDGTISGESRRTGNWNEPGAGRGRGKGGVLPPRKAELENNVLELAEALVADFSGGNEGMKRKRHGSAAEVADAADMVTCNEREEEAQEVDDDSWLTSEQIAEARGGARQRQATPVTAQVAQLSEAEREEKEAERAEGGDVLTPLVTVADRDKAEENLVAACELLLTFGDGMRPKEERAVARVLKMKMAQARRVPNVDYLNLGKEMFVRLPIPRLKDAGSNSTNKRRASVSNFVNETIEVTVPVAVKVLNARKEVFQKAAEKTKLFKQSKLGVEETMQLMRSVNATWTGMRAFRTLNRHLGSPLGVAGERECKAFLEQFRVPTQYHRVKFVGGSLKAPCEVDTLLCTSDVHATVASDMDYVYSTPGLWQDRRFKNDPPPSAPGRKAVHIVGRNDKGASVVKHTHALLNRCRPCSFKAQSVTASAEAARTNDKPPSDNHANFAATFAATHGFSDLDQMGVVRVGGRHVLVPSRSIPPAAIPTHELSDDDAAAFAAATKEENQTGTPAERAARRAEAEVGGAQLVHHKGVCLGVRTGRGFELDSCFAFRGVVAAGEMAKQEVLDLVFFYSADLLALATMLGMDNQAGSCCLWCRGEAWKFKVAAAGGARLDLRSVESQHADYLAFVADTRKGTKNVNGVSAPSLLGSLFFLRILPPFLHLDLGLTNSILDQVRADCRSLGRTVVDAGNALKLAERVEDMEELGHVVVECVDAVVELMGGEGVGLQTELMAETTTGGGGGVGADEEEDGRVTVAQVVAADWTKLLAAARERASDLRANGVAEAHQVRVTPVVTYRGLQRAPNDRDKARFADAADEVEKKANKKADEVAEACDMLDAALGALRLKVEEQAEFAEAEVAADADAAVAAEAKAKVMGLTKSQKQSMTVLEKALKDGMDEFKITVQKYWIGTLVGPDCRRFFESLRPSGNTEHVQKERDDFLERHMAVAEPLRVALRLIRRVEQLKEADQVKLKAACAEFGSAWRTSYPDHKILTPKGHVLEVHVPEFCDAYDGWLGVFGEDGLEALHPKDSLCRRLVRQMRNPEARHRAHALHLSALQHTRELDRIKHTRRSTGGAAAGSARAAVAEATAHAEAVANGPMPMPLPPPPAL